MYMRVELDIGYNVIDEQSMTVPTEQALITLSIRVSVV